jgi:hypothetical protein
MGHTTVRLVAQCLKQLRHYLTLLLPVGNLISETCLCHSVTAGRHYLCVPDSLILLVNPI